ncbi:MAG: hypothetical protein J2P27_14965, partial [Actinobacteria bacterium]|nr:hypothetical protein [Actinomycetota bacterium]
LTRLGFTAARVARPNSRHAGEPTRRSRSVTRSEPAVEALRPFIGQWVAMRGDEVLVAADSPKEVVTWLSRHQQRAHAMFRVAASEQVIDGAAPR